MFSQEKVRHGGEVRKDPKQRAPRGCPRRLRQPPRSWDTGAVGRRAGQEPLRAFTSSSKALGEWPVPSVQAAAHHVQTRCRVQVQWPRTHAELTAQVTPRLARR